MSSAVAQVASATASGSIPRSVGDGRAHHRHPGRAGCACRGAAPAPGTGCRSRRAGGRAGTARAASCRSVADGNVTMPLNDSTAPRSRQRRASSGPPVKQWNTVRGGHALGGEDVEGVGPRLAGVDHEREVVGVGQRDLGGEHLPLHVAGRVVVVEVEAALPHGHDLRLAEERLEAADAVLWRRGGGRRRWPTRRRGGGGRRRCRRRTGPRRSPTVISRSTPASAAAATCSAARTGSRSRWQWSSIQRAIGRPVAQPGVARGKSGSPLATGRPPG